MATAQPQGSRFTPPALAVGRAEENSTCGLEDRPADFVVPAEQPAVSISAGFADDQKLCLSWHSPTPISTDACAVVLPVNEVKGDCGEASVLQQLESANCPDVLAPGPAAVEDDASVMEALGCRTGGQLHQEFAVDRYGAAMHTDGTYAMLTPLQPLPPISAVSERLGSGNQGGVGFMHTNGIEPPSDTENSSSQMYSSYKFCPTKEEFCGSFQQQLSESSNNRQDPSEFAAMQYTHYGQTVIMPQQLHVAKPEFASGVDESSGSSLPAFCGSVMYASGQLMSVTPVACQVKPAVAMQHIVDTSVTHHGGVSPHAGTIASQPQIDRQTTIPRRVGSPDQPSSSTDVRHDLEFVSTTSPTRQLQSDRSPGDEISTRDVALRVSSELKRYSIPQAVFAQRILGRSQGTLSDLLRNPKPWSKLKSGRETFRRMWKWLQEPEYQRMAALRSVAGSLPTTEASSSSAKPLSAGMKRSHDAASTGCVSSGTASSTDTTAAAAVPACSTKKPRMVFTEIQRRTLVAIFREIKRPSKEIQATIAEQLGLKVSTVVNFFMNARRRSVDKYTDDSVATDAQTTGRTDRELSAVSSTAGGLPDDSPPQR